MELRTTRLRLRPWRDDDLASLTAMNAEPEVNTWLGGPGLAERSGDALRLMQARLQQQGWGILRVEDLAGTFLGLAGLQPLRPSLPIAPAIEAVWRFRRAAWGHGYACEAMTALLPAARQCGAPEDIVALIAVPNLRSAKTAERIGFRHDPSLDFLHPALDEHHPLRPHRVFRLR